MSFLLSFQSPEKDACFVNVKLVGNGLIEKMFSSSDAITTLLHQDQFKLLMRMLTVYQPGTC